MLLHDLSYAGVGGCTVEELRERLTMVELQDWAEYRQRRGPLNVGERIEQGIAMIITALFALRGVKKNVHDFMPHFEKPPMRIEEAFSILTSSAMGHRARKKKGLVPRAGKRREKGTLAER